MEKEKLLVKVSKRLVFWGLLLSLVFLSISLKTEKVLTWQIIAAGTKKVIKDLPDTFWMDDSNFCHRNTDFHFCFRVNALCTNLGFFCSYEKSALLTVWGQLISAISAIVAFCSFTSLLFDNLNTSGKKWKITTFLILIPIALAVIFEVLSVSFIAQEKRGKDEFAAAELKMGIFGMFTGTEYESAADNYSSKVQLGPRAIFSILTLCTLLVSMCGSLLMMLLNRGQ